MLSFAVTGRVDCVLATAPEALSLAISSVLMRDGEPSGLAGILCVARESPV